MKQVTVFFSDLCGYTSLTEQLGPEEVGETMNEIFRQTSQVVERYGGRIDKLLGDGVIAVFGDRLAHEDDPERAVRAVLELHAAVEEISRRVEPRIGRTIALHSGIASGVVLTNDDEIEGPATGPVGDPVNVAARLQALAAPGQVLIAPETQRLTAGVFDVKPLGPQQLKGKAEPILVTEVCGVASERTAPARRTGEFVGRQEELGVLLAAAERLRDGQPSVITVSGEAGTGKTRLLAEFRAQLGDDVGWLEGRAYAYGQNIAYLPVIDLLNTALGIDEDDSTEKVRRKLADAVDGLLGTDDPALAPLLRLYDIDLADGPPIDREAYPDLLLDAVRRLVEARSRRDPTVVCFQDLHWADPSTVALLRSLVGRLETPVLVVGNFRPGFTLDAERERAVVLDELSSRQTGQLLRSLLEDASPPPELETFIETHTDGNPFFVEEIVNNLIETGTLVSSDGSWALSLPLSQARVPATIRGVIEARIDHLDEQRRRLLREAAVVGREFLYRVVAEVTTLTDDVKGSLSSLESADFIREKAADPDLEYLFKHALTQEVAYDGMVKADRQRLHERVARAVESVLGERIGEFVETLAFHFARAGVADKAVYYLVEAGKKGLARYSLPEATAHFRQAYDLLVHAEDTPGRDLALAQLIVAWSPVYYYDGTINEWLRLLDAHLDAAERAADAGVLAMYLGWMGNAEMVHGDLHASLASLERADEIAQAAGDEQALRYIEAWLMWTRGDLGHVGELGRAGLSDFSEEQIRREPYPWFKGRGGLARAAAFAGSLPTAREIADEVIAFGQSSGNGRAEFMGHASEFFYWYFALDVDKALAASYAALEATNDPCYGALAAAFLVFAQAATMEFEGADALLAEWLPRATSSEMFYAANPLDGLAGGVAVASGDLSRGMRRVLAARDDARARGYVSFAFGADLQIARAYVAIARREGIRPSVGRLLRNPWFVATQAVPAARKARALLERLRAEAVERQWLGCLGQIDFLRARLYAHTGDRDAARDALASVRRFLDDAGVAMSGEVADLAAALA